MAKKKVVNWEWAIYSMTSRPESFRVFLSCANYGFCHLNLAGITKFEYEKKNEKGSGRNSKMTPLCKWPIGYCISTCISIRSVASNSRKKALSPWSNLHMVFLRYFKVWSAPSDMAGQFPWESCDDFLRYWYWADDNSTLKFYRTVSNFLISFCLKWTGLYYLLTGI